MKQARKVTPTNDLVLIRLAEPAKKVGNILLPDVAQKKNSGEGKVVAVGPDCKQDEGVGFRLAPGMSVLYNSYGGTEVPFDDTLLLLREDEVLAVVE